MRSTLSMVNDAKRTVHSAFDGLAMEDPEGAVVRSRVVKKCGKQSRGSYKCEFKSTEERLEARICNCI